MPSLKLGLIAAVMFCALSATAQAADCVKVATVGEAVTHDIAKLFATNGLANIIAGKGREGRGPIRTTCKGGGSATTTCHASQMACKVGAPKACLGAWLCLPSGSHRCAGLARSKSAAHVSNVACMGGFSFCICPAFASADRHEMRR